MDAKRSIVANWPDPTETHTWYDVDDEFYQIYFTALAATQTSITDNPMRRQRFFTLYNLLKNLPIFPSTVAAEAGCWRGLSTYLIAFVLQQKEVTTRLAVFDSFEGLSSYTEEDKGSFRREVPPREHFACSLEATQDNLRQFSCIDFYKGWIPQVFNDERITNVSYSFAHVDVDLYKPTRDSFHFFYPRLIRGGVILFDDYGYVYQFPGAKKAIDEGVCFYRERGEHFVFFPLTTGQAVLIKT